MSSSILIRTFQSGDLQSCRDLFRFIHEDYQNPDAFVSFSLRTDMSDIEKYYLDVPDGNFWVVVPSDDNQRILGQIAFLPLKFGDPRYYRGVSEDQRDQICELRRMAVDPSAQRQGIGNKLVNTFIEYAREKGYKQIHLTTARNMTKAMSFYDKFGFRRTQINRYSLQNTDLTSEAELEQLLKSLPELTIFQSEEFLPEEDQQRIDQLPKDTGYLYVQHYLLDLD